MVGFFGIAIYVPKVAPPQGRFFLNVFDCYFVMHLFYLLDLFAKHCPFSTVSGFLVAKFGFLVKIPSSFLV